MLSKCEQQRERESEYRGWYMCIQFIRLKKKMMVKGEPLREYIIIMSGTKNTLYDGKGSENCRERKHKSIIVFINIWLIF